MTSIELSDFRDRIPAGEGVVIFEVLSGTQSMSIQGSLAMTSWVAVAAALACSPLSAQVFEYEGEARSGDRVVYREHHRVSYDDGGQLLSAETNYVQPEGIPIAHLRSNFQSSVTLPLHEMRDERTNEVHGVRREGETLVMYLREPGKPERRRVIQASDSGGRILIGSQGLHYYLLANVRRIVPGTTVRLRFLIPGRLEYFDFDLRRVSPMASDVAAYEITVKNWFLRLFAPTLHLDYDIARGRLIRYAGLSNINADSGAHQVVSIQYRYP